MRYKAQDLGSLDYPSKKFHREVKTADVLTSDPGSGSAE